MMLGRKFFNDRPIRTLINASSNSAAGGNTASAAPYTIIRTLTTESPARAAMS
jgi:hypothetical protein